MGCVETESLRWGSMYSQFCFHLLKTCHLRSALGNKSHIFNCPVCGCYYKLYIVAPYIHLLLRELLRCCSAVVQICVLIALKKLFFKNAFFFFFEWISWDIKETGRKCLNLWFFVFNISTQKTLSVYHFTITEWI